jgi:hypothetical protein
MGSGQPWWRTKRHQKRVGAQLQRCMNALHWTEPS